MAANTEGFFTRVTTIASNIIGSWGMIVGQTILVGIWFCLNLVPDSPTGKFDNSRFDTLRLLLALQSVYTAPLILMAQRRTGAKDRAVLHEVNDASREAMERRNRLEEKIDRLLAKRD